MLTSGNSESTVVHSKLHCALGLTQPDDVFTIRPVGEAVPQAR